MKLAPSLAAIAFIAAPHFADAASFSGYLRDFRDTHPDFEGYIGGLRTGQVADTLGADGLPVWNGPAKPGFTSEENFNQWYRDVSGVNQSVAFNLDLVDNGSGTFTYSNSSFFPLDGQLFGNEGRSHNYHFTLQLAGDFAFSDGDNFNFTGDDDLWVFVDGKLMMDIGGVHGPTSRSFNSTDLTNKGLVAGQQYRMDIFFAERHTSQSNFNITSSFNLVAPPPATPIPLPAALPLALAGFGGLALLGRRRR